MEYSFTPRHTLLDRILQLRDKNLMKIVILAFPG